jgi:hypothetical protein
LLDGINDAKGADAFVTGPLVGKDVLGGELYPAPLIDGTVAQNYVARIEAAERNIHTI